MLDKLLNLNTIHEVRKKLKANDIRGEAAANLEAEWLKIKDTENVVHAPTKEDKSIKDSEKESVTDEEVVVPNSCKKPFKTPNYKK